MVMFLLFVHAGFRFGEQIVMSLEALKSIPQNYYFFGRL